MSKRNQFKRDNKRRIANINRTLSELVDADLSFTGSILDDKDIPIKIKKVLGGKVTKYNPFGIDYNKLRLECI